MNSGQMKTLRYFEVFEIQDNGAYDSMTGRRGYLIHDVGGNPVDFTRDLSFFNNDRVKWEEGGQTRVGPKGFSALNKFKSGKVFNFKGRPA